MTTTRAQRIENLIYRTFRARDRMDRRLTVALVWNDPDTAARCQPRLATLRARLKQFVRADAQQDAV